MTTAASNWTFGLDERRDAYHREQAALKTIAGADPEFARMLTRKLVPDRPVENPDVIRKVTP